MNERHDVRRGLRLRLLMLLGYAVILGLIDLVGHLVWGVDIAELSSRESPLPTSQAFPLFLGVLALVVGIEAGCWWVWRWFHRRERPAPGWQPPR